ncbi:MAG TPA: hypothetical protein VME70_07490 [Mycobacteriales bacterium]|nr:hypothetical protein [Mycobacteriales bacterium]
MPTAFQRHSRLGTAIPTLGVAGFSLAIAIAGAVPAGATTAIPRHEASTHSALGRHHGRKELVVKGLVASHHGQKVTVFASSERLGTKTRHDKRIKLTFAHTSHRRVHTGDHITLVARGTGGWHKFRVSHRDQETVSPAPAALLFGSITAINGTDLTVSVNDLDNGSHHRGWGHGRGHGSQGEDATPAHHGPGGGEGGGEGGHHGHHGHQVTIDDSEAMILVDGTAGTLAVGDTVAVLGEVTNCTVVAADIFAFSSKPAFELGWVVSVNGENVKLNSRGRTTTVSLAEVPLAINGDLGADPSQLNRGDKLLIVGTVNPESGAIIPDVAFAFNHHDHHPCGHHGGDEGGGEG